MLSILYVYGTVSYTVSKQLTEAYPFASEPVTSAEFPQPSFAGFQSPWGGMSHQSDRKGRSLLPPSVCPMSFAVSFFLSCIVLEVTSSPFGNGAVILRN